MKNHWSMKALCLILAALCGVGAVLAGYGMIFSPEIGYGELILTRQRQNHFENEAYWLSGALIGEYARSQTDLSAQSFREFVFYEGTPNEAAEFDYVIIGDGQVLENTMDAGEYPYRYSSAYSIPKVQLSVLRQPDFMPTYDEYIQLRREHAPELRNFPKPMEGTAFFRYEHKDGVTYRLDCTPDVYYEVKVAMTEEQAQTLMGPMPSVGAVPRTLQMLAFEAWAALAAACAAVWLAVLVFTVQMAGKAPGTDLIRAGGLNRLPLELWIFAAVAIWVPALIAAVDCTDFLIDRSGPEAWACAAGLGLCGAALGMVPAALLGAVSAQVREKIWLKNSICVRVINWCLHRGRALVRWIWTKFGRLWSIASVPIRNLPLCWQWLAGFGFVWLMGVAGMLVGQGAGAVLMVLTAIAGGVLVLYLAGGYEKLHEAARHMARGDLDRKIDTADPWFRGCFGDFAADLNTLSDTCTESAREQMKSQRMKTELITNVSHDIKTPLTSIINYVDLLQGARDEQQRTEYLQVLERQSRRLKKLIEDLMEMSKASSGNLTAELGRTDVGEAVSQALGEFSDAMAARGLKVLWEMPAEPVLAMADGRLLWRVLGNLLGNTVKYAMEGTRVYLDLTADESRVQLCIKNISEQMLNISAEELTERFVRGDRSRSTEGNGLGLNIAGSLMEVQKGSMAVEVDGDLFKVILNLPRFFDIITE